MSRIGEGNFEGSAIIPAEPGSFLRKDLKIWDVMKISIVNTLPIFITMLANKFNVMFAFNFMKRTASEAEIAAFGLGFTFCAVVCFAIIFSLCMGLLTRMSQAYGDNAHKLIGYYLHRGIILNIIVTAFICVVIVFSDQIFLHFNYNADLAYYTHQYLVWCIPGCVCYAIFTTLQYYLIALKIAGPPAIMQIITSPIYIGVCYYLVVEQHMGVIGCAIALGAQNLANVIIIIGYIGYKKPNPESLFCLDSKSFDFLWDLFKHEVETGSSVFFVWIGFEILGLIVGTLGNDATSGYMATATIMNISYMVPVSLDNSTLTYVGSAMGCKNVNLAKSFIWANVIFALISGAIITYFFWFFWPEIIINFVGTDSALHFSEDMMDIYKLVLIIDFEQIVLGAAIRAIDKSSLGFLVSIVSFYVLTIPIAVVLCFTFGWGMAGINWGYNIGLISSFIGDSLILAFADFREQSVKIYKKINEDKLYAEKKLGKDDEENYNRLIETKSSI